MKTVCSVVMCECTSPPPQEPSTNPCLLVVCLCWCSRTSVLLCVVLICNGGIVVMSVSLHRFYLNMRVVGDISDFSI